MEALIFDRVQADVISKTAKGYYNATDLNRIEEWTEYVANKLNQQGYVNNLVIKKNWATVTDTAGHSISNYPTVEQLERIRSNINELKTVFTVMSTTPNVPNNLEKMDITKANVIEKILYDINTLITNMINNFYYVDEIYSGEG